MRDVLRLRIESARPAWLDINGSANVPIASLPYGAGYVPVALTDTVDDVFGPLALPDLRGDWLFALQDDALGTSIRLQFHTLDVTGDEATFRDGENTELVCRSPSGEKRAGCEFKWTGLVIGTPPPGTFPAVPVWVPLGNIEEERMRGSATVTGDDRRVVAHRIPRVE